MSIDKVIQLAKSQIGVREIPHGSNLQKYGVWYGMNGVPWCAIFVSWCFHKAGVPLPVIQSKAPSGGAYCPYFEHYARKVGQWHTVPKRGDLALFHFGNKLAIHIGIVDQVKGNSFTSIEGNTSVSSNDNGGSVMLRPRNISQCRGFFRPLLEPTGYYRIIRLTVPFMEGEDIRAWQTQANYFGYGLDPDGVYGEESEKACRKFQTTRGLKVDGEVGEITWAETFKKLN